MTTDIKSRVQFIRGSDGRPSFAVLPVEDYLDLIDAAEGLPRSKQPETGQSEPDRPEAEPAEPPPPEVAARLDAGENPILVWREHRGVPIEVLAGWIGFDEEDVTGFETGELIPTLEICQLIAHALDVDLADVLPR